MMRTGALIRNILAVLGLVLSPAALAEDVEVSPRACFQVYDEAEPILREDFSLRLYRSGQDLSEPDRATIQSENEGRRLSETVLGGGTLKLSDYRNTLKTRTRACDRALLIPDIATIQAPADIECAVRYGAIGELALEPLQRVNFYERQDLARRIYAFHSATEADREIRGAETINHESANRSRWLIDEDGRVIVDEFLMHIKGVQACDVKYGLSPMLIPGNFDRAFGRRD
ncbi:MAG: hypothetical protein CMK06_12060 [Ponticaulis sp.]|nr:hypothetical protein [Ponticaulis sp.]